MINNSTSRAAECFAGTMSGHVFFTLSSNKTTLIVHDNDTDWKILGTILSHGEVKFEEERGRTVVCFHRALGSRSLVSRASAGFVMDG